MIGFRDFKLIGAPPRLSWVVRRRRVSELDTLRFVAERSAERFEIIEGMGEGFYVLRYIDGLSTHDYLQNDILMAQGCAEDQWGLPAAAWRTALPGELPWWQRHAEPGAAADGGGTTAFPGS